MCRAWNGSMKPNGGDTSSQIIITYTTFNLIPSISSFVPLLQSKHNITDKNGVKLQALFITFKYNHDLRVPIYLAHNHEITQQNYKKKSTNKILSNGTSITKFDTEKIIERGKNKIKNAYSFSNALSMSLYTLLPKYLSTINAR